MNMAEGVGQSHAVSEENTQPVADPKCVFCRIVAKQEPAAIVYEDEDYLCFRDKSPAATHHYLLVPKTHIRDPNALTYKDLPIVEKMGEIGTKILTEQGGNPEDARMGFHWPPFILVHHLHLHILSPQSSLGWFSRYILFREDSFAFISHPRMVERLRSMSQ